MNLRSARKLFTRSPATFRPMARWIWNDHLDSDRLAAQLDAMLDAGFGGALIRPGEGLPHGAYLGEAWFEAVSAVAKRARKRRGSIWIAEDLDDPATQEVVRGILREAPDRAAQILTMDDVPAGSVPVVPVTDEVVAAFEVTRESARPAPGTGYRTPQVLRALTGTALADSASVRRLFFRVHRMADRLNLFDADATLQFIEHTHQRYQLQARKYFGNTIGLGLMIGVVPPRVADAAPWDAEAPALFQETYGYSLIASLPALFFDLPGHEAIRFDYWSLLDAMLAEGFTSPFARWCGERGIPHACALPAASTLAETAPAFGRAMARHAEHSFSAIVSDTNDIVLYEARSVKRQLGQEGVLEIATAESIHATTAHAMRRAVHGVNFLAERTVLASLRGDRKRDNVTTLALRDNEPHLRAQLDAETRLAWMLGQGRVSADVLVLHPYASLKASYCAGRGAESSRIHAAIARHFTEIVQALAEAAIAFDCGDEVILARHGRAEHRTVRVGRAEYRAVVLPPLLNLRSATLGLLHDFAISGGLVLAVGSVPELLDGRRSDQVLKFFEEYGERVVQGSDIGRYSPLIDRLRRANITHTLADAEQDRVPECVTTQTTIWDEIAITGIHNDGDRAARVQLETLAHTVGRAELWDPATGGIVPQGPITSGEPMHQLLTLEAGATNLVVSVPEAADTGEKPSPLVEEHRSTPPWSVRRVAPNVTALSECRIAESSTADWLPPGEIRRQLAERITQARGPVSLRTQWRFRVAAGVPPIEGCAAVAELSEGASMRLNGDELETDGEEWILDASMRVVPLPPVSAGEHTLEIWRLYASAGDFQAPWLRGSFANVTLKDECTRITPSRPTLSIGLLASQGLLDYFGDVVYTARIDGIAPSTDRRVVLRLRGLNEPAQVRVDGSHAGFVLPPRTCVDLTEFWRAGTRNVEITLRVPPGNLLAQLREGRNTVTTPHGLPAPPELVTFVRD